MQVACLCNCLEIQFQGKLVSNQEHNCKYVVVFRCVHITVQVKTSKKSKRCENLSLEKVMTMVFYDHQVSYSCNGHSHTAVVCGCTSHM